MPENNVGFTLQDANSARYFWRLCVLQHTFFMKYEQNQMHNTIEQHNIFQNQPEDLCESKDNLFMLENNHQHISSSNNLYASDSYIASTNPSNWQQQQQHQQPDSCVSSNMSLAAAGSQQQLRTMSQQNNWQPALSNNDLNRNGQNWTIPTVTGNIIGGISDSNSTLSNRVQSSSCLDLSNNNISTDRERLKAFLPGYRPAPDYETAVQQKYRTSETELRMNASSMNHIQSYAGSQPDVHRSSTAVTDEIYGEQLLQHKYPDVTQTANLIYQQQQQFDMKLLGLSQQLQMMKFNRTMSPYAGGAANRLSSTSTPDLALASHRALLGGYHRGAAYVSGSSPDLVSTRTFLNPHFIGGNNILTHQQQQHQQLQHQLPPHHLMPTIQSAGATTANTFRYRFSQSHLPHGTYENLNFVDAQTKTNLLSQKLQKAYEDAYRTKPLTNNNNNNTINGGMIKHQHTGSIEPIYIEPIYENVPLPRSDTNNAQQQQQQPLNEMRDRASSMQSMPGVIRYKQPPIYHANDTNNFNASTSSIPPQQTDNSQTLYTEPTVVHRAIAKSVSTNSAVSIIKPPSTIPSQQQQHNLPESTSSKINTISAAAIKAIQSFESTHPSSQLSSSATAQTMNRSMSSNVLDSSHNSSSYTNITTTTTDSGISFGTKEKKKRRWGGFFGGSKNSLNDKQKSATLGRDRNRLDKNTSTSSSSSSMQRNDEFNFRHRWSTGLQRIPLPASISKEKLVSTFIPFICFLFYYNNFLLSKFFSVKFWKQNYPINNFILNLNKYQNDVILHDMNVHYTMKIVYVILIQIFCHMMIIGYV